MSEIAVLISFVVLTATGIGIALTRYRLVPRAKLRELTRLSDTALTEIGCAAAVSPDEFQKIEHAVQVLQTKMRQTSAQVTESHAQLASLHEVIGALPTGIVVCEADYRIIFANIRAEQMLQARLADFSGKHLNCLFPTYAERRREELLQDLEEKARGKLLELPIGKRDGEPVSVDVTISDCNFAGRKHIIIGLVDITERKQLEKLKQELVAVVSHDLKTPLTTVSANLTMLAEGFGGKLDDQGTTLVTKTEHEIKRLMNLIKDILDLEKMEAGKFQLEISTLPLFAIIEAAADAVDGPARRRNIEINVKAPDIDVSVDGDRIVQVLINLLSNAVKFSPPDSCIKVEATNGNGWLEIRVIDQGRGIPDKFKDAVFEKFRQVTRDDARLAGGTGLGLPICKAIVEQHGGRIGFDSTEGAGTTFWLKLPSF